MQNKTLNQDPKRTSTGAAALHVAAWTGKAEAAAALLEPRPIFVERLWHVRGVLQSGLQSTRAYGFWVWELKLLKVWCLRVWGWISAVLTFSLGV